MTEISKRNKFTRLILILFSYGYQRKNCPGNPHYHFPMLQFHYLHCHYLRSVAVCVTSTNLNLPGLSRTGRVQSCYLSKAVPSVTLVLHFVMCKLRADSVYRQCRVVSAQFSQVYREMFLINFKLFTIE